MFVFLGGSTENRELFYLLLYFQNKCELQWGKSPDCFCVKIYFIKFCASIFLFL